MKSTTATDTEYPLRQEDIPYTTPTGRLQTLDIWLPRPLTSSLEKIWIIYVHGGAWRDPAQDSKCVEPTIKKLQSHHPDALGHVAGIISLNYRLSPYPSHPTSPSSPTDPQRNVQHPEHIQDVQRAIKYLKTHYNIHRWIGVGHSCGATLLLQQVAGIGLSQLSASDSKSTSDSVNAIGPEALVLLEGIYDIPLLLQNHTPPACPPSISQIYYDIVQGAFGDASTYSAVSPVSGKYEMESWADGRLVVLAHSPDDELVEEEQRVVLLKRLEKDGWARGKGERVLELKNLKGGHDEIWEEGTQIAQLIAEVVSRLCAG